MKSASPLFAILLLCSVRPCFADLVMIDTFEVGPHSVTADSNNNNVNDLLSGLDPAHVLDGRRLLTIQGEMSSGSITATVDTDSPGTITYSSASPVYTNQFDGRLLITHVPGNRFSTTDLSSFSNQFYKIDVIEADLGSAGSTLDAILSISSPTGSDSVGFQLVDSDDPYTIPIDMAQLSGVDLSRSFNMRLDIGRIPSNASFKFDRLYFDTMAVPEPSHYVFLGALLLVALIVRFKRRSLPTG